MASIDYQDFLKNKMQLGTTDGFDPVWIPDFLFDFQRDLVEWAIRKGRAAIFADCGLGKTPMQLVWARNVTIHTGKKVLIVTPLAVGFQTLREGKKFGIDCERSSDGDPTSSYVCVTNYENLHKFNPKDFIGIVCDESSILKNFDGKRKAEITEFMRLLPYRLCCTATAAPNDYIELGTTSEALGEMGFMDMLTRFFKNDQNSIDTKRHLGLRRFDKGILNAPKWRFKKHAEIPFWKWVSSWAKALRRPSDMGYKDDKFNLPPLIEKETMIENEQRFNGALFVLPAIGLKEQREERRLTIQKRCEMVAEKVNGNSSAVIWCHLNDEGDLLEELIPDAVQVSGSDNDDRKEAAFMGFTDGTIKKLITKPKIGGFGMNWQHCSHITFFPSHSFEQYYQAVRRCWRFGQTKPVTVDIITSKGEIGVLRNLQRKAEAADNMFSKLVMYMNSSQRIDSNKNFNQEEEIPSWL